MPQLFPPRADRRLRWVLAAMALLLLGSLAYGYYRVRSGGYWDVGEAPTQPIAFSHALHVGGVGMECRYCHLGAQDVGHAGMPSAHTCLTCHSQLWRGVPELAPLMTAVELGQPIRWEGVSLLPAHARFHHGAHAEAGVECATCHGNVAEMQEMAKAETLSMDWCVDCHRAAQQPRPGVQVAALGPPGSRWGHDLTDCAVCHY